MTSLGLTSRQKQALDFIRAEIVGKGIPPTYEEIRVAMGLASKSGVARLVEGLAARGFITSRHSSSRSIALVDHVAPDADRMREALRHIATLPADRCGEAALIAKRGLGGAQ